MKSTLFAVTLLGMFVRSAWTLRPAPQAELDAINAELHRVAESDADIEDARARLRSAEGDIKTSKADLRDLERTLDAQTAKQRVEMTRIIHMTIHAFDIAPDDLHGTSVMRWTKGRNISWMPIGGEGADRLLQTRDGKLGVSKLPNGEFHGVTFTDGVTYIPKGAFSRGVGYLASVLLHEKTHFLQYTTPGKGDVMTEAQRQQEAYKVQIDAAGTLLDPVKNKAQLDGLRELLRAQDAKVAQEKGLLGRFRGLLGSPEVADQSETCVRSDAELADIRVLVARARSQADIARRDREQREAAIIAEAESRVQERQFWSGDLNKFRRDLEKLKEVPADRAISGMPDQSKAPPVRPEKPTLLSAALRDFRQFAIDACRAPDQVTITRTLSLPYDHGYNDYDDLLARDLAQGLADCPRLIFSSLISAARAGRGRSIDRRWVVDSVSAFAPSQGASPAYNPPPEPSGKRCEDYGNIRCP